MKRWIADCRHQTSGIFLGIWEAVVVYQAKQGPVGYKERRSNGLEVALWITLYPADCFTTLTICVAMFASKQLLVLQDESSTSDFLILTFLDSTSEPIELKFHWMTFLWKSFNVKYAQLEKKLSHYPCHNWSINRGRSAGRPVSLVSFTANC